MYAVLHDAYRGIRRRTRIGLERLIDHSEGTFVRLLDRRARPGPVALIVDHRMGGGSNIFRERLVERLVAHDGAAALLVTIGRDDRQVECHLYRTNTNVLRHRPRSVARLLSFLDRVHFDDIIINDLVTWPNPIELATSMLALGKRRPTPITIYFHDHFFLCPSWSLLNYLDRFCGLPVDPATCNHCLKHHEDRFVIEGGIASIQPWREASGALLEYSTRLICFSHYTASLVRKCFPDRTLRVEVKPHELLYVPQRIPERKLGTGLHIGVLGNIGFHKGARVIEELSELLVPRGQDAEIIIIGRYSRPVRDNMVVHGKYERSELAELIERYAINVFLFPSIWPETFSYVCAEIMALEMPLVAFDLGAPAERIRDYSAGWLVEDIGAEGALRGIDDLLAKLRR